MWVVSIVTLALTILLVVALHLYFRLRKYQSQDVRHLYKRLVIGAPATNVAGFKKISSLCRELGIATISDGKLPAPGTRVIIVGTPTNTMLKKVCRELRRAKCHPVVVTDALGNAASLHKIFCEMNEHQAAQFLPVGGLIPLLKGVGSVFFYAFPKADATTSMVILFDGGRKVLVMVRKLEPFKGWMSLPGGFLDPYLETLPECAVRELFEEVFRKAKRRFLSPSELVLIDVRSSLDRDTRGHVLDHGYAWLVPPEREVEVLNAIEAGDDAAYGSARIIDVKEALAKGLAFDHSELLRATIERFTSARSRNRAVD